VRDWEWIVIGILVLLLIFNYKKQQLQASHTSPQFVSNEETWTWTDYKGREYKIEVHRRVS